MKQAALRGKVIAAIRIRGRVNVRYNIKETLDRLNLKRVNNCTIIKVNDPYLGMLKKCVNQIAYGEVDEETLAKLVTKFKLNIDPKGVISGKVDITDLNEKMPMRLHPPRHGLKSVRRHFNQGGSLGYMGKEINGIINRMV
ncbi:MAG: uL30 family ribosomal protein [Candidatus Micrarchaeales archaeon]